MSGRRVLLATTNAAKQDELRRILDGLEVTGVTPAEAGATAPLFDEEGGTHLEVAVAKARAWASVSGLPALASDGGLSIPALGPRWNGLRNRRFAGPTDDDRIEALLALMEGLDGPQRNAFFREAVALALPDGGIVAAVEARGPDAFVATTPDPRRQPGFWVTPLLLYPPRMVTGFDLTSRERAELVTAWDRVRGEARHDIEKWLAVSILPGRSTW